MQHNKKTQKVTKYTTSEGNSREHQTRNNIDSCSCSRW